MEAIAGLNPKALTETYQGGEADSFSLVLGGPLFQLLRKAHLEGDALEFVHRRTIAAVLLTWFPLFVLSALNTTGGSVGRISFLRDIEAHARFLAALPILIAAELLVHVRIRPLVHRFLVCRLLLEKKKRK